VFKLKFDYGVGRQIALALTLAVSASLLQPVARPVAHEKYNDGLGKGCVECHGAFRHELAGGATMPYESPKGDVWAEDLHNTHRKPYNMGTDCNLCHFSGPSVWTYKSAGELGEMGFSCSGCHGHLEGDTPKGYGLRAHHLQAGEDSCLECHDDDGEPVPEDVLPPYYGVVKTKAAASCNNDEATTEDWSGNGIGLDNDGDGLYDMLDSDCIPCPDADGDGFQNYEVFCNTTIPELGGDCDDSSPTVYPGAPETCNAIDDDCDGLTDEESDYSCDDGVDCTLDTCFASECQNATQDDLCDDDISCTVDSCSAAGCLNNPDDDLCVDGVPCTIDTCIDTGCDHFADHLGCDDEDPCTEDLCVPPDGCTYPAAEDETLCDDGDPCSGDDMCTAGACAGHTPACGECLGDWDCIPFDDGNPCNGKPVCKQEGDSFYCKTDPDTVISCPEDNLPPCVKIGCNPETGLCQLSPTGEDLLCDLGSQCVSESRCKDGVCEPVGFVSCDDGNPCTDDSCDWAGGCANEPNELPCDDDNPCTELDFCAEGTCAGEWVAGCCLVDSDCEIGTCENGLCVAPPEPDPEPVPELMPEAAEVVPEMIAEVLETTGGDLTSGEKDGGIPLPQPRKLCPPKGSCSAADVPGDPASGALLMLLVLLVAGLLRVREV